MPEAPLPLTALLGVLGITHAEFSRATGISKAATSRLLNEGIWPARSKAVHFEQVRAFLKARGAKPAQIKAALETAGNSSKAIPSQSANDLLENSTLHNLHQMPVNILS